MYTCLMNPLCVYKVHAIMIRQLCKGSEYPSSLLMRSGRLNSGEKASLLINDSFHQKIPSCVAEKLH